MVIQNLGDAIALQAQINTFLAKEGIKDLVGDYGELLVQKAIGGQRENAVNQGFDISHPEFGRIEVKTRKYELRATGTVNKENRAVGFTNKENGFDWLAHVVLDTNFKVVSACLSPYSEVWPEVLRTKNKISYATSSSLPSSIDVSGELQSAQAELGFHSCLF